MYAERSTVFPASTSAPVRTLDCTVAWSEGATGPVITLGSAATAGTGCSWPITPEHVLPELQDMATDNAGSLTFGVWLSLPDADDVGSGGRIQAIAQGTASAFQNNNLAGLTGSANYKGEATGKYATRAAGSHLVEAGYFTATATLKASFDAPGSDVATAQDPG